MKVPNKFSSCEAVRGPPLFSIACFMQSSTVGRHSYEARMSWYRPWRLNNGSKCSSVLWRLACRSCNAGMSTLVLQSKPPEASNTSSSARCAVDRRELSVGSHADGAKLMCRGHSSNIAGDFILLAGRRCRLLCSSLEGKLIRKNTAFTLCKQR